MNSNKELREKATQFLVFWGFSYADAVVGDLVSLLNEMKGSDEYHPCKGLTQ